CSEQHRSFTCCHFLYPACSPSPGERQTHWLISSVRRSKGRAGNTGRKSTTCVGPARNGAKSICSTTLRAAPECPVRLSNQPSDRGRQREPAGERAQRDIARHFIPMIEIGAKWQFAPHGSCERAQNGGHR